MSLRLKKGQQKIAEQDNKKLSLQGNLYRKNKRRISFSKLFKLSLIFTSFLVIVFITVYAMFLTNHTNAETITQKTILNKLSQTLTLPDQPITSVMRVSNAEELAKENAFYKDVKNGDYIIVFQNMVIIYDFNKGLIKNVKTN